jgi:ABC-type sugar transport system substrate-binding protein
VVQSGSSIQMQKPSFAKRDWNDGRAKYGSYMAKTAANVAGAPVLNESVAASAIARAAMPSATGQVPYVGLDNWKLGRTAAWTFANICKTPRQDRILLGNPRYRNQEMNETVFRSHFRELTPEFARLEPLSTHEFSAVAQEMTEKIPV